MITPASTAGPSAPPPAPAKTAHNIFWLVAERSLKAVGGVFVGVLLARHLGPDDYGRYGAAIGLATLAKEAVMLGFDRIIRRDLAARPERAGAIVGTSIAAGLVLAFTVALALTLMVGRWLDDDSTRQLALVVIWMALPQAFFACEIWFESAGMTRPLVWTRNVVWIAALIGRVALVFGQAPVLSFAILALVEWVVTYAAVCWLLRRLHRHELRFSFDGAQLAAWFREGRPVVLMALLASAADRLMVLIVHTRAATEAEAGYLSAALRITDIWWSISTIIAAVLLPRIVGAYRTDPAHAARTTQLYANASLLVGVGAAAFVTATAPFIVPWIFGAAYAPSARVLAIVFWAGPAIFPAVSRGQSLVSRGMLILELPSVAATAALQLGLALWLIPGYGATGAAIAIAAGHWLGFYGLALAVPALRRASEPQLKAFRALMAPWETLRALRAFVRAMLRKD